MSNEWTEREVELTLRTYFEMLEAELKGEDYTKAEHRRDLKENLNGRSESAIEYKFQNISAALDDLGYPFIEGYKPASNYQTLLKEKLVAHLDEVENLQSLFRRQGINPDGIEELAQTLSRRAEYYYIGGLQRIRKEVQGLQKRPSSDIFSQQSIIEDGNYAFHTGGRDELQFNVGLMEEDGDEKIRYGVGFSLQISPSMIDMEAVQSRIAVFNEYIRANSGTFGDFWMWHYPDDGTGKSADYRPGEIPNTLLGEGVFIFLGKRKKPSELSYDDILELFDRLLPLYIYIEENVSRGGGPTEADSTSIPRQADRTYETTAEPTEIEISVDLRHNKIQDALESKLSEEYGAGNVKSEYPSEYGRVDLVVETGESRDFYEIKPYSDPRLCIREAVGQLLEYAYWSGMEEPDRLVIVGESEIDGEAEDYLLKLWEKFGLPVEYEHFEEVK